MGLKVVNLPQITAALRGQLPRGKGASVITGYTANYGIFVHENLQANHTNGQAKFLEEPVRQNQRRYADKIRKTFAASGNMELSLMAGGLLIQRDSQKLVPVLTGNLKASAFTRPD